MDKGIRKGGTRTTENTYGQNQSGATTEVTEETLAQCDAVVQKGMSDEVWVANHSFNTMNTGFYKAWDVATNHPVN